MIKITEPKRFKRVKISEIKKVNLGKGGVYFIEDRFGEIIYIGKTASFRRRLVEHVRNSHFSVIMSTIRLYEIEDELSRELYETYLINKYRPYYNKSKVYEEPIENTRTVEYHEEQAKLTELQTERAELLDDLRRQEEYEEDVYDDYDEDDRDTYQLGSDLYAIKRIHEVDNGIKKVKNRIKTLKSRIF